MQTYTRDFLGCVGVTSSGEEAAELAGGDPGEVELSLGLSLGGCSAVEPKEKRKELKSLKRLEAKRKRIEDNNPRFSVEDRKDESFVGGEDSNRGLPEFLSNSQGSSSSGVSNLQGGFDIQRSIDRTEVKSPPTSAVGNHIMDPSKEEGALNRTSEKAKMRIMMQSMPCVSTSQNGRTIEGFLYKYKKEEAEARIVCVCHGSFLTPAEFVKHAGGGDVAHPLRHIFVNPPHRYRSCEIKSSTTAPQSMTRAIG